MSANGGRIRRVTITEIVDEKEVEWPENSPKNETFEEIITEKNTKEIFDELENVVQAWKKKLEIVVADGLRTIKQSTKEKKMMMKYLPGEGTMPGSKYIKSAKCQILTDWRDDVNKAVKETHFKLNDLNTETLEETFKTVGKLIPENEVGKSMKVVDSTIDLKTLMAELDNLYKQFNNSVSYSKIPIYKVKNGLDEIPKATNMTFSWWKPVCNLAKTVDYPRHLELGYEENRKGITSLLRDFIADQKSKKAILEEWQQIEDSKKKSKQHNMKKELKSGRRGRNSIQKMRDRKDIKKCRQFMLKEIENQGQKHYYVIKKEKEDPSTKLDIEDIFADWKNNFAKIKRPRVMKPRIRKISHRAERKQIIKDAKTADEQAQGPLTYSQIVRRNLKIPVAQPCVEDIFSSWIKCVEQITREPKHTHEVDPVEAFELWNFIFSSIEEDMKQECSPFDCGKPTMPVKSLNQKLNNRISSKTNKKQNEEIFSSMDERNQSLDLSNKIPLDENSENLNKPLNDDKKKIAPIIRDFKPSNHSKRTIVQEICTHPLIRPNNKPEEKKDYIVSDKTKTSRSKDSSVKKPSWSTLISRNAEESGRGEVKKYKAEEIFDQWRHIFVLANKQVKKPVRQEVILKQDIYFMEWLRNFDELVILSPKKERNSNNMAEEKSPKSSKRDVKKQQRHKDIEDDCIEFKDNRRQDFIKATMIRDKKRSEASRKSFGKRVK